MSISATRAVPRPAFANNKEGPCIVSFVGNITSTNNSNGVSVFGLMSSHNKYPYNYIFLQATTYYYTFIASSSDTVIGIGCA